MHSITGKATRSCMEVAEELTLHEATTPVLVSLSLCAQVCASRLTASAREAETR